MSPSPLPSPLPIKPAPAREPELVSKWTIVNDHWVEAQFLLARSASGLSDRPAARSARNGS
jgi:hypothetical protein